MIEQEYGYIQTQKIKYLKQTIIWGIIVGVIFFTGILMFNKRETYFTVMAGVMVMGIALNLSRYVGFSRFKDGNYDYAKALDEIKGDYYIFHSAILLSSNQTAFFEHIVVTNNHVFFIAEDNKRTEKYRITLENVLKNKGITYESVYFYSIDDIDKMKEIIAIVQNSASEKSHTIEEYKNIISGLLM